jgi:hypothetical protein
LRFIGTVPIVLNQKFTWEDRYRFRGNFIQPELKINEGTLSAGGWLVGRYTGEGFRLGPTQRLGEFCIPHIFAGRQQDKLYQLPFSEENC